MKVSVLDSNISVVSSYEEAYKQVKDFLQKKNSPTFITVNNVHTVVEGVRHPAYRRITNQAYMALPDGKPLVFTARWRGIEKIDRIFGPTFFEKCLEWGQADNLAHFFFGSTPETLEKMAGVIAQRFSLCQIKGMISPPFRRLTDAENGEFINQMNVSGADLIWVALGAPKQEYWMYENYYKLKRGVMIGIGAGFDYLAGNIKHAPKWMKNMALEWLYRLCQEPGRLWKRYLITNSLFIFYLTLELAGIKRFKE